MLLLGTPQWRRRFMTCEMLQARCPEQQAEAKRNAQAELEGSNIQEAKCLVANTWRVRDEHVESA